MSGSFKRTGRNVQVSRDDLINVTIEQLMAYESTPRSKRARLPNPYTDVLYTKVDGGKIIQIPKYIQHAAILRWDELRARSRPIKIDVDSRPQGAHTRLDNRDRYADADPYVMDKDLRRDLDDEYPADYDYPADDQPNYPYTAQRRSEYVDDQVQGIDSDINAEIQNTDTHSEKYAYLDDNETPNNNVSNISDAYDTGCRSCAKNPVIYRGQQDRSDNDHYNPYGNNRYADTDTDVDIDADFDADADSDEDNNDTKIETENIYKYLFFIMLFILAFIFIYYRNKFDFN